MREMFFPAVNCITEYRVADKTKVDANLVGSARQQPDVNDGIIPPAAYSDNPCYRLSAHIGPHCHFAEIAPVPTKRGGYLADIIWKCSVNKRNIFLGNSSVLELLCNVPVGIVVFCTDKYAGCPHIEPVNNSGPDDAVDG